MEKEIQFQHELTNICEMKSLTSQPISSSSEYFVGTAHNSPSLFDYSRPFIGSNSISTMTLPLTTIPLQSSIRLVNQVSTNSVLQQLQALPSFTLEQHNSFYFYLVIHKTSATVVSFGKFSDAKPSTYENTNTFKVFSLNQILSSKILQFLRNALHVVNEWLDIPPVINRQMIESTSCTIDDMVNLLVDAKTSWKWATEWFFAPSQMVDGQAIKNLVFTIELLSELKASREFMDELYSYQTFDRISSQPISSHHQEIDHFDSDSSFIAPSRFAEIQNNIVDEDCVTFHDEKCCKLNGSLECCDSLENLIDDYDTLGSSPKESLDQFVESTNDETPAWTTLNSENSFLTGRQAACFEKLAKQFPTDPKIYRAIISVPRVLRSSYSSTRTSSMSSSVCLPEDNMYDFNKIDDQISEEAIHLHKLDPTYSVSEYEGFIRKNQQKKRESSPISEGSLIENQNRLHVSNIPFKWEERHLIDEFESFGPIKNCTIIRTSDQLSVKSNTANAKSDHQKECTRNNASSSLLNDCLESSKDLQAGTVISSIRSRGYGFITFENANDAETALQAKHGAWVCDLNRCGIKHYNPETNRKIEVNYATVRSSHQSVQRN